MLLTKNLFALLNNERVLDDTRIDRQIADRLRAQVKKNEEVKEAERAGISEIQSDEFNKILLSFSSTLDDYVSRLETGEEQIRTVGLLIYRYNLLSQNLKKLNFNSLPKLEKDKLVNSLEDLEPKLEELVRYAEINNFTDLKTLKLMLTNFKNKLFQSLPVGDVRLKDIRDLPGFIEDKINSILDFPKFIDTDKEFFTKTELKEIDKKVSKTKEIAQSIRKGILPENKVKELYKYIDDFKILYSDLEKRKEKEASKKRVGRPKKTTMLTEEEEEETPSFIPPEETFRGRYGPSKVQPAGQIQTYPSFTPPEETFRGRYGPSKVQIPGVSFTPPAETFRGRYGISKVQPAGQIETPPVDVVEEEQFDPLNLLQQQQFQGMPLPRQRFLQEAPEQAPAQRAFGGPLTEDDMISDLKIIRPEVIDYYNKILLGAPTFTRTQLINRDKFNLKPAIRKILGNKLRQGISL